MKNESTQWAGLAVELAGEGPEAILLFHGYGQSIAAFDDVIPGIPLSYRRFHFHLPAHGESLQAIHRPFDKESLRAFFLFWFEKNGVHRFSVAGYSLGGKMALLLAEFFPERLTNLILIAPDGIKPDYADLLFNRNAIGRAALRMMHRHPFMIKGSLILAQRSGVMHEKVYRYFLEQTSDAGMRIFALNTWKAFRKLRPDLKKVIAGLATRHNGRVMLIYGRTDKIVPSVYMRKFAGMLKGPVVKEFPGGHQLLNAELAPVFRDFLSHSS